MNKELNLKILGYYNGEKLSKYKKWKKQRIRQSFCDRDLFNMDCWLCNVIPDALDRMIEIKCGTPTGWTEKEYKEYVKTIADDIRKAYELNNVYMEENHWPTVEQVKVNKMESDRLMKSAFARLANIIWTLWD